MVWKLILSVYGKGGIGLGVQGICGVNIYGKLEYKAILDWYDNSTNHSLGLNLGLEGTILLFRFNFSLGTIQFIDKTIPWNNSDKLSAIAYDTPNVSLANYSVEDAQDVNAEDEYIDSRPQLISFGDKKILAWIENEDSRDDFNFTCLKYSVFSEGVWGKVQSVYDNGHSDLYPSLYFDGEQAVIVWSKINTLMKGENTFEDMLSASEIFVSVFNDETNSFANSEQLTKNNIFDSLPQIAKKQKNTDELTVTWSSNSNNDCMGLTGTNSIYGSTYSKNGWSEPKVLYSTTLPITTYDAAYIEGQLSVAVNIDTDSELATIDDREIVLAESSATYNITDSEFISSNPQFAIHEDKMTLFYYEKDKVVYLTDFYSLNKHNIYVEGSFGDNFKVVSDGTNTLISYPIQDPQYNSRIYATIFDSVSGEWNSMVPLSDSKYDIKQFGIIFENSTVNYAFLDDGIKFGTYILNNDIGINNAYLMDSVIYNEYNTLYLDISNNGSFGIKELFVTILENTYHVVLENALLPDESITITIKFFVDKVMENYLDISVAIDRYEENLINNAYSIMVKNSKFSMQIEKQEKNSESALLIRINNCGNVPNSLIVQIKNFDENGKIYYISEKIEFFLGGYYVFEVDLLSVGLKDGMTQLYIEVIADEELIYELNDELIVSIKNIEQSINNPYYNSLQYSKHFLS